MFVPKAVYEILKDYPDGLTAKKITEEVIARGLHPLPAKQPVSIVTRAIHRHCIGIDRTYSCQDRFFSKSTNKQGDTVYKIAANYSTTTTVIAETFVFPRQQIAAINSSSTASGSKTRIMDAENQTVRELLGKYCFYVPAYQRSYSWKSSHIDEFLDDIFNVIHSPKTDARHFLGAITMAKRESRQDSVDLIDGQQRMTTIFIFLYVILGQLKSERFVDKAKSRADELFRKLVYLNDDGEINGSRLILGEFNKKFFDEFIIKAHDASDEVREDIKKKYIENSEFSQNQAIFDAYNRIKLAVEERLDCCKSEEDNGFCNPGGEYPWKSKIIKDTLYDMNKMRYDLAHPILLAALRKYPHDEVSFEKVVQLCLNFLIRYISVLKNKPTSIEKDISAWACDPEFSIEMLREKFLEKAPDAQFKAELLTLSLPFQSPLTHYILAVLNKQRNFSMIRFLRLRIYIDEIFEIITVFRTIQAEQNC